MGFKTQEHKTSNESDKTFDVSDRAIYTMGVGYPDRKEIAI